MRGRYSHDDRGGAMESKTNCLGGIVGTDGVWKDSFSPSARVILGPVSDMLMGAMNDKYNTNYELSRVS